MRNGFKRKLRNTFYFLPWHINKFKERHPGTQVIVADITKAQKVKSNQEVRSGFGWVAARRCVLILTANGLFCGDLIIPLASIDEATLLQVSRGSVLKVSTADGLNYQFGLQRNPEWEEQRVLPLTIKSGAVKLSIASVLLRLLPLAWYVYLNNQENLLYRQYLAPIIYAYIVIGIVWPLFRLLKYRLAK